MQDNIPIVQCPTLSLHAVAQRSELTQKLRVVDVYGEGDTGQYRPSNASSTASAKLIPFSRAMLVASR